MIDMEEKKPVLHKPTQWERLGSFACSHFLFSIFGAMVLVGGLPPLLFLLGSIWGSRRAERGAVLAKEESEVQNGTEQRDATA